MVMHQQITCVNYDDCLSSESNAHFLITISCETSFLLAIRNVCILILRIEITMSESLRDNKCTSNSLYLCIIKR